MHSRILVVSSILASLLLAACGGGGSSKTSGTSSSQGTATTQSSAGKQNVAADKAAAEAAALKLSDFPAGWTSKPQSDSNNEQSLDGQLAKCLGVNVSELNHEGPADFKSPEFSDANNHTVSNDLGYTPSVDDAKHEFAVVSGPKVPGCLQTALAQFIKNQTEHPSDTSQTLPPGATFGNATVAQMSFPTFGDESIAYRVTIPVKLQALSIPFYADFITARKGRAGTELDFESVGTPFATDQEQHYAGLVVDRMANT